MKLVFLLIASMGLFTAGCGVGRHVQKGMNDYERGDYPLAAERFQDLEAHEDEMNDKGLARYLVYRGLTEYRLGHADAARSYLVRAQQVLAKTPPETVKPRVLLDVDSALADLESVAPSGAVVVVIDPGDVDERVVTPLRRGE